MVYCVECQKKTSSQTKAYRKTENGKAKTKKRNDKPETKAAKKTYRNSPIGKKKSKDRAQTEEFKQGCRDYAKSDAGKKTRHEYYEKNKLSQNIMNAFARVLRGEASPIAVQYSSFESEEHIRNHFKSLIEGTSMTAENYGGNNWGVDHRIPRSQYDHSDMQDVRNCWSPENMQAMGISENKQKSTSIIKREVEKVPSAKWPKAWNGAVPV